MIWPTSPKVGLPNRAGTPTLAAMKCRQSILFPSLAVALLLVCGNGLYAVTKPHTVGLGPVKRVPHTAQSATRPMPHCTATPTEN